MSLDQAPIDILNAAAGVVRAGERAGEQRHHDISWLTRWRDVDVARGHHPVDISPTDFEADPLLALAEPEVRLAGGVGIARTGRLLRLSRKTESRPEQS